jgi:exosome complex component RRP42
MMINKETIAQLAGQKKRLDGRSLGEYRQPIRISTDISWTAEGSVKVQIGETIVLAGVKLSIEKPYNDTPDEGGITVNVELTPLSNPEFEPGPPSIKAIELARVVDRGIREAKAVDFKKLCITPGEKAWFILVDIITLNDSGNLFDASALAALAALKDARFPVVKSETGAINYKEKTDKKLPLKKEPVSVTVYKINGQFLVDPSLEEDHCFDARLTVASDNNGTISALQKGGESPLSTEDVSFMINLALDKAKFLRAKLEEFLR